MPDAESMYNLIERGGIIALLLLGLIGLAIGFISGLMVPGWIYKEKKVGEERALQLVKDIVETVRDLTNEIRELRNQGMRRER